jgi:hypothetical protein
VPDLSEREALSGAAGRAAEGYSGALTGVQRPGDVRAFVEV